MVTGMEIEHFASCKFPPTSICNLSKKFPVFLGKPGVVDLEYSRTNWEGYPIPGIGIKN
jgi:hypothetical protein